MTFSASERQKLADLLHDLGPDAPTLCEGWTTRDMASHLLVRETDPLSAAGMMVPPLSDRLERAYDKQNARDYDDVVTEWANGPRGLFKVIDRVANSAEHFVHHEDVRRGGGEVNPREFSQEVTDQLTAAVKRMAPMLLRGSDKPVILTPTGGEPITVGGGRGVSEQGDDVVRVTGDPGELLLWIFGRDAVKLEITGDVDSVSR